MTQMDAQEYAERIANNTANMLEEMTLFPDGTSKGLTDTVAAGVITAQSNLAIAAALMWVASELKERR